LITPDGNYTQFAYDPLGNRIKKIDSRNNVLTKYIYAGSTMIQEIVSCVDSEDYYVPELGVCE